MSTWYEGGGRHLRRACALGALVGVVGAGVAGVRCAAPRAPASAPARAGDTDERHTERLPLRVGASGGAPLAGAGPAAAWHAAAEAVGRSIARPPPPARCADPRAVSSPRARRHAGPGLVQAASRNGSKGSEGRRKTGVSYDQELACRGHEPARARAPVGPRAQRVLGAAARRGRPARLPRSCARCTSTVTTHAPPLRVLVRWAGRRRSPHPR